MRRLTRAVALLLVLLALTGCWSRREINDLGLVVTMGIDLTEEGLLQVTLVVAQPAAGAGGKGKESPGAQRPKVILTREGRSLTEAMRMTELAAPRQINLTHAQVIVLGERLVEEGIDTYMDYLLRDPQVRSNSNLVILRGAPVVTLLEADPVMENLQSQALREMEINLAGLTVTLREFYVARATDFQAPLIPVMELRPHQSEERNAPPFDPELGGAAVMRMNKVLLYLDQAEIRGAMWLRKTTRGAVLTVPCPGEVGTANRYASVRVLRSERKVRPVWNGHAFTFYIELSADLRLTEVHCLIDLEDQAKMAELTGAAERLIEQRVKQMLERTQGVEADPFMFGEYVRAWQPGLWGQVGNERWGKTWSEADLEIEARLRVEHTGTTKSPANYDLH